MAKKLRIVVRNHNLHQSLAALREKREIAIPTFESATAARADLIERVEGIRLRVPALTAADREAGSGRRAARNQVADRRLGTLAPVLCDVPGR